jgi:hypothetical protein
MGHCNTDLTLLQEAQPVDELRRPKLLLPLSVEATVAFCIAAVYWLVDDHPFFVLANAFWFLVSGAITLLIYRHPHWDDHLAQSFLARFYRGVRPYVVYVGMLVGIGYALTAVFWWQMGRPFLTLANAAWAIFFATVGFLVSLRGLRCALAITCLAAGGLYLVTATWWFAEGHDLSPTRGTSFFCFNLMWCALLITAGLIIDRSRPLVKYPPHPLPR